MDKTIIERKKNEKKKFNFLFLDLKILIKKNKINFKNEENSNNVEDEKKELNLKLFSNFKKFLNFEEKLKSEKISF